MNDLREKLAEIVSTETSARIAQDEIDILNGHEVADAIISAMPCMVHPLVWDIVDSVTESTFGLGCNRYTIWAMDGYGYVLFPNTPAGERFDGGLKSAKAAAQAHHVATILSAFGVQGGET